MPAQASVKLDTSGIQRIAGQLAPRARIVIGEAAFEVESDTRQSIAAYPAVDTGAYMASTYTSCGWGEQPDGTTPYTKASKEAATLNPTALILPEEKADGLMCNVGHSVNYAYCVEMGLGGNSKIGPRPSLVPAFEIARKRLLEAWGQLVK